MIGTWWFQTTILDQNCQASAGDNAARFAIFLYNYIQDLATIKGQLHGDILLLDEGKSFSEVTMRYIMRRLMVKGEFGCIIWK
jgi:hypothetical protein